MNKKVSEYFINRPALLEFGEIFIENAYNAPIKKFIKVYEGKRNGLKIVNKVIEAFSDNQLKILKQLTIDICYYVCSLELDYYERHGYKILVNEDSRIKINDISDSMKQDIMRKDGLIDSFSEYTACEELREENITYQAFQDSNDEKYVSKQIPEYYMERPALMNFGETFVKEVYDYAINRWFTAYEKNDNNGYWKNVKVKLASFMEEDLSLLKQYTHFIIYDSLLLGTGIFESFNFWLVINYGDKEVHISYTDPDEEDFDRNELSFEMHDTAEDGIINLFSKYGVYEE